ncbi:helix-turn-helix domain-containing protein [Streptomyces aidingensis]|uniref:Helix-turn-helix domain-containing protein n=1 Tax=Streptomyces aidingensis TaxID=910347 RepID=A0A1I1F960_9ACTN|nr:helix-turn-helix transcriptional regulator [Streptomyces aidingensis]SFB93683.1 Helix-turn-helix domain-containing protein [Streptomyces aidingensis]
MPPRINPSARERRLGAELRKLREKAGRTAREAGALIGTDQSKMSNIEAGYRAISEERIRRLAAYYACTDAALIEALCAMAGERRGKRWWDEYRGILSPDFLDVAELEHHATYLRSVQIVSIPGLLQTEDYAEALFRGGIPPLPEEEVRVRTEYRMRRKVFFERPDSPPLQAIIHEAALRMRFGGRQVVRNQLEHLIESSRSPAVDVRVVPFTNERFIEATQPVVYAGGVVPHLDTVHMDSPYGGRFADAETVLENYRAFFDHALRAALDPEESRQLIHHIAREL